MRDRPAVASAEAQTADLYEQYGQDIYRFCSRRLRSHEEAEDAVQNTFLRVYGALRKGIVPEFETAWLYKIAHNVCLSRIAGKTRTSDFETLDDGEILETLGGNGNSFGNADELFGLDEALARMPENLRRAILLREWQGLSYAEIAEVLGVSQSAVETLIFRARRHLAQALEGSVKRPARRVVAGLNLGSGLAALRGWLFGTSGAAKLAAAGALAVGLAGGGVLVEHAVVSPGSSAPPRPRSQSASSAVSVRSLVPSSHRAALTPTPTAERPRSSVSRPSAPTRTHSHHPAVRSAGASATKSIPPAASAPAGAVQQAPAAHSATPKPTHHAPTAGPGAPHLPSVPDTPQLPAAPTVPTTVDPSSLFPVPAAPTISTPTLPAGLPQPTVPDATGSGNSGVSVPSGNVPATAPTVTSVP